MKNAKRTLLSSVIALILCFSMLLGSTFAWFTDVVTSGNNIITAGNMDIGMYWSKNNVDWNKTEGDSAKPIFENDNWEPGYTEVRYVKVTNDGNLAFKYKMLLSPNGTVGKLAEAIDVSYDIVTGNTSFVAPTEVNKQGSLSKVGTLNDIISNNVPVAGGVLLPEGESKDGFYSGEIVICLSLKMREDAGNEYQNSSIGSTFNINLYAAQYTYESDSFDTGYDSDAEWPEGVMNFEVSASLSGAEILYDKLVSEFVLRYNDSVYAVLPANVKLKTDATSLKFTGNSVENGSNIKVEEDAKSESYDIHIEGIADDNTQPIKVYLGAMLDAGISDTSLKLYHEDELMTRVESVDDFTINNQYTYNSSTGEVVLYVDNFSVFSVVQEAAEEWDGTSDTTWYNENDTEFTLTTAEQFAGFRYLVDGGNTFAGKTIKLGTDINLANKPFDPIGFGYYNEQTNTRVFMGTFDGGRHTVYNLYQNGWELDPDKENYSTYTYSTAGAGLFASIKDATIKNLAISGAEIVFECVDMGIVVGYAQGTCHFENIIVTDSKIANYNRYTGGVVGEVSYGPYGIDTTKGYSHTFKNITVDSSVKVCGLWGSFGCGMGGVIGGKWGDATVKMENVISAPVMDVYNDVVSAYQWYAFRGCGMLIGHTEEPYSDGRHSGNATASFLTCENVKVYYGDWVNYHYYEFENQDNTTGQRYPWVRAEAGEYCDAFSNIRYGVPTHGGIKVSDLTEEELKAIATDYTPIVFDQLYGADRGMYGTATHEGVTVLYNNTKTIYMNNNLGWENLKLYYWFENGADRWTTVVEGITLKEVENNPGLYEIKLPAFADGYKIIADGENETREFYLSEVTENGTYNLDFEHVHSFISNGKCDCGAVKQSIEHQFTLGENGEAKHSDGGNAVTTYEENGFTLTLTGLCSVYGNARDEMGNSCIKLGTGSLVGEFSFTVPENVVKAIIYVAGYKANDSKISVNGVEYGITTCSNDGEYTAIEVDTTETKTVSFTTVEFKDESRCMINTISFVTEKLVEVHECDENEVIPAVDPTCTETGLTEGKACSVCGKVMVAQETVDATGHTEETIPAVDVTCTKNGLAEGTKCSVCDKVLVAQEVIISTGHNYVDGICENCGEAFPTTSGTYTYVFSDYTAGTQYAENEEHVLDKNVTIFTTQCHFTNELRIYSSGEHNGFVVINSANPISKIAVNAGENEDTLVIYGSNDGIDWTAEPIATISVTSTSYKDYTAELKDEYKYLKIDVEGSKQVRLKSMTLTTVPDCAHASTKTETIAPTCTESGYTVEKCSTCGKEISRTDEIPATGHINTTTTTVDATCTEAGSTTVTCDDCGKTVSTEEIAATGHNYNEGEITKAATCTEKGEKTYTCGTCEDTKTEEIDALGHNYVDGACTICGAEKVETTTTVNIEDYASANNWADSTQYSKIELNSDIIATATGGGNTGKYYTNGTNWRLYQTENAKLTIAAENGNKIVSVKITYTNSNLGVLTFDGANIDSAASVNVNSATVIFGVGNTGTATNGQVRITAIEVVYETNGAGNEGGETACEHTNTTTTTVDATCTEAGSITVTCDDCGETVSTETVEALGHTTENGTCENCGETIGGSTEPEEPTVVLEITKDDFNSTSYAANNNTKTEGDYSYTSNQVMNQSSVMQWQKSKGYITIASNDFVKLEIKVTAGTFTVTVGGKTVTGTTSNGATTYDLTGLTGEVKISVGDATGKVDYLKFYK